MKQKKTKLEKFKLYYEDIPFVIPWVTKEKRGKSDRNKNKKRVARKGRKASK